MYHHRSMADSIDWSVRALTESERAFLAKACYFPSGFTLEAAERVIASSENALDLVSSLVDHSLLYFNHEDARFEALYVVREFAKTNLQHFVDQEFKDRFLESFVNTARTYFENEGLTKTFRMSEFLLKEGENTTLAISLAMESSKSCKSAFPLIRSYLGMLYVKSKYQLLFDTGQQALDLLGKNATDFERAIVLGMMALSICDRGEKERALTMMVEVVRLLEQCEFPTVGVWAQVNMGIVLVGMGRHIEAFEELTLAANELDHLDQPGLFTVALRGIAACLIATNRANEAYSYLTKSREEAQLADDQYRAIQVDLQWAVALWEEGKVLECAGMIRDVLQSGNEANLGLFMIDSLWVASKVSAAVDLDEASILAHFAATSIRNDIGANDTLAIPQANIDLISILEERVNKRKFQNWKMVALADAPRTAICRICHLLSHNKSSKS